MNYKIIRSDKSKLSLLPHPQEPIDVIGRLLPKYDGHKWDLSEVLLDTPIQITYPDVTFDPMEYVDNPDQAAFLAIQGNKCIGSIRVCARWQNNAFIDDLAIDREHRGHGVGTMLMDEAVRWGQEKGLYGVSVETQDWNLLACRFYLKYGYRLGGLDCSVYDALEQPYQEEVRYTFICCRKWYNVSDIIMEEHVKLKHLQRILYEN